jgi:8-oxo-dGTP pyrophosphatase MutT (NUDIX family)
VLREVQEECGYYGQMKLVPLYVFRQGTFSYYNFLAVVSDEFEPELDWETQGYVWTKWGMWPQPLHFGLQGLLSDKESARKMKTLSQARRSR